MKRRTKPMVFILAALLLAPVLIRAQRPPSATARILSARFVYFEDQTGTPAVGRNALAELRKWRRFEIVADKREADLILVLTAGPPKGDQLIVSGGQTGTIEHGELHMDAYPNYSKSAPVRWASLTVIDPHSGQRLWADSHQWGGLLTGFNSAGARLIKQLKKQTRK